MKLSEALAYCNNLVLGGYFDWRLPNMDEQRSLVRGCSPIEPGGACGVTAGCLAFSCDESSSCNDNGCSKGQGPAVSYNGYYWPTEMEAEPPGTYGTSVYWSSSKVQDGPQYWYVNYWGGAVLYHTVSSASDKGVVRCVR